MPEKPKPEFIVAEVSKNWERAEYSGDTSNLAAAGMLISNKFEHVIEVNRQRGYELHSFELHRLMTGPDTMNETIIAVFQRANLTPLQQLAWDLRDEVADRYHDSEPPPQVDHLLDRASKLLP